MARTLLLGNNSMHVVAKTSWKHHQSLVRSVGLHKELLPSWGYQEAAQKYFLVKRNKWALDAKKSLVTAGKGRMKVKL